MSKYRTPLMESQEVDGLDIAVKQLDQNTQSGRRIKGSRNTIMPHMLPLDGVKIDITDFNAATAELFGYNDNLSYPGITRKREEKQWAKTETDRTAWNELWYGNIESTRGHEINWRYQQREQQIPVDWTYDYVYTSPLRCYEEYYEHPLYFIQNPRVQDINREDFTNFLSLRKKTTYGLIFKTFATGADPGATEGMGREEMDRGASTPAVMTFDISALTYDKHIISVSFIKVPGGHMSYEDTYAAPIRVGIVDSILTIENWSYYAQPIIILISME